jgi:hypothetical protein
MEFINSQYDYITPDNKLIQATLIIDWNVAIEISFNDMNSYKNFFELFQKELIIFKENLLNYNRKKDKTGIILHKIFHTLKGTGSTLGFNTISCFCEYYCNLYKITNNIKYMNKKNIIDSLNILNNLVILNYNKNLNNFFI